jgi:hypothetical protein
MNAKIIQSINSSGKPSVPDYLKMLIIQRAGMSTMLLFSRD